MPHLGKEKPRTRDVWRAACSFHLCLLSSTAAYLSASVFGVAVMMPAFFCHFLLGAVSNGECWLVIVAAAWAVMLSLVMCTGLFIVWMLVHDLCLLQAVFWDQRPCEEVDYALHCLFYMRDSRHSRDQELQVRSLLGEQTLQVKDADIGQEAGVDSKHLMRKSM